MDKKEFEKELNKILKQEFKSLGIENYKTKAILKKVEFFNEEDIADISYSFLPPKFIGLGTTTALSLSSSIKHSEIGRILKDIHLGFNIPPYIGYSMTIINYTFPKTDYYPEEDIFRIYPQKQERWKDLLFYIKEDILPRIDNYLNVKLDCINDIFSNQDYYKYPLTTIMIILCMNKKESEIDKYIELAKSKKLYDAEDKIILETREKVFNHFGIG